MQGRGDQMLTYSAGLRAQCTPLSMGEGVWAPVGSWGSGAGEGPGPPLKLTSYMTKERWLQEEQCPGGCGGGWIMGLMD